MERAAPDPRANFNTSCRRRLFVPRDGQHQDPGLGHRSRRRTAVGRERRLRRASEGRGGNQLRRLQRHGAEKKRRRRQAVQGNGALPAKRLRGHASTAPLPTLDHHAQYHIISQDGSLLAACINASTLALIDAGIPMTDYLVACTAASSASSSAADNASADDPLLDLNTLEEQELPFLTVGTLGDSDKVAVCVMETRVRMERLEGMLAVGIEGCKRLRGILDEVVKGYGKRFG
jgi:hypothetical protein